MYIVQAPRLTCCFDSQTGAYRITWYVDARKWLGLAEKSPFWWETYLQMAVFPLLCSFFSGNVIWICFTWWLFYGFETSKSAWISPFILGPMFCLQRTSLFPSGSAANLRLDSNDKQAVSPAFETWSSWSDLKLWVWWDDFYQWKLGAWNPKANHL